MLIQQGDVLIKKTSFEVEEGRVETEVLAEGEATGHAHRIHGGRTAVHVVAGIMYLKVLEACQVIHEEHKPVDVPPGTYEVYGVREYDHFEEEARRVTD
jgi:hypothetical protein